MPHPGRGIVYSCMARPSLRRQGGGFRHARPLHMGDTWDRNVAPSIAPCARFRTIHHVSRAPLTWLSCCEIPGDVTRTRNLRGLPCRLARACRPGDSLRVFREQNTQRAACDAPHTRSHGDPCFPNSHNLPFNRARAGFVPRKRRFSRRGLLNNSVRYTTQVSCLDRSVS